MFKKVIVFGLFKIIQKKKVRTASSSSDSAFGSGRVR